MFHRAVASSGKFRIALSEFSTNCTKKFVFSKFRSQVSLLQKTNFVENYFQPSTFQLRWGIVVITGLLYLLKNGFVSSNVVKYWSSSCKQPELITTLNIIVQIISVARVSVENLWDSGGNNFFLKKLYCLLVQMQISRGRLKTFCFSNCAKCGIVLLNPEIIDVPIKFLEWALSRWLSHLVRFTDKQLNPLYETISTESIISFIISFNNYYNLLLCLAFLNNFSQQTRPIKIKIKRWLKFKF